jgi:hypothetical protein
VSSGRRITVALVALVLLAVVGWLATGLGANQPHQSRPDRPGVSAPVSPSAPKPAGASG